MFKLIIFDFDFTIAKTVEHILVVSPRGTYIYDNKQYRRIHPTMFQQQGMYDDETLDNNSYIEFYRLNIQKTKIITPVIEYLKFYSKQTIVNILTARPQDVENNIMLFLKANNVDTKNIKYKGLCHSSSSKKVEWIKKTLIEKNYSEIILFEDNKKVIDSMIKENSITTKKSIYYIQNYPDKTLITFYDR